MVAGRALYHLYDQTAVRDYPVRSFNALSCIVQYGIKWRVIAERFPPWSEVDQQAAASMESAQDSLQPADNPRRG